MIKKIGNVITDIFILILTFCFIVSLYHYTSIKILNHPYTNFFGYTYFNIKTGSMADTINVDDYVFVKITDDVEENDIISYVSKDEVITHRLISIKGDEYITKGDANNKEDDPIQKEQIIGKVIKVGVQYGVVLKIITEPAVLISFLVLVLIINLLITSYKKKKYDELHEEVKIPKIKVPVIPENDEEKTQVLEQLQKIIEEQKAEGKKKNKNTEQKVPEIIIEKKGKTKETTEQEETSEKKETTETIEDKVKTEEKETNPKEKKTEKIEKVAASSEVEETENEDEDEIIEETTITTLDDETK